MSMFIMRKINKARILSKVIGYVHAAKKASVLQTKSRLCVERESHPAPIL